MIYELINMISEIENKNEINEKINKFIIMIHGFLNELINEYFIQMNNYYGESQKHIDSIMEILNKISISDLESEIIIYEKISNLLIESQKEKFI